MDMKVICTQNLAMISNQIFCQVMIIIILF